jgi:hypothetical protein
LGLNRKARFTSVGADHENGANPTASGRRLVAMNP